MLRLSLAVLWALGLTCCRSAVRIGSVSVPRDVRTVSSQPKGAVVRLLACEGAPSIGSTGEVLDGLLREAMRQSWWLDVAAGPVAASGPASVELSTRIDNTNQTATVRWAERDLVLASASTGGRPISEVMDELAARTRIALGDPVGEAPAPLHRIYSSDLDVVAACEASLALLHEGRFAAATDRLAKARRRDGACAFLLDCAASAAAMQGDAAGARRLAQEALSLTQRLSPTTTHRLLRTLMLARAAAEPQLAAKYDQELATLAQVGARERPYDPEPKLTEAIANNFLARFEEARATLRTLAKRMRSHPAVQYHLGWAELGSGHAAEGARAFAVAAGSMPPAATVVPRSIALYEAGLHAELEDYLEDVAADPAVRDGAALHEVRRMQIAHSMLRGDRDAAIRHAFLDLDWLANRPGAQEQRAGEFAEFAETVVRMGEGPRLRPYLTAILDQESNTPLADAATFALALADCAAQQSRSEAAEDGLRRKSRGFWADALAAFGYRQLGQLAAENQALGAAAAQSSSPLLTAALAHNLRAQGRDEDAKRLIEALRRDLNRIHLRRKLQHPLLGPELAFAWLAN